MLLVKINDMPITLGVKRVQWRHPMADSKRAIQRLERDLVKAVREAWEEEAKEKLAGKGEYLARYRRGMQVGVSGGLVRAVIDGTSKDGFEALKLEEGWAPAQDGGSGLGTYTGAKKDMRPSLLHGGKGPDGTTKDGHAYRRIPLKLAATAAELIQQASEQVSMRYFGRNLKVGQEKLRKFAADITQLRTGQSLGSSDLPMARTTLDRVEEWSPRHKKYVEKTDRVRQHVTPMFDRITRMKRESWIEQGRARGTDTKDDPGVVFKDAKNKEGRERRVWNTRSLTSFQMVRTISDSPGQKSRFVWFSAGVPPHKILASVKRRVRDIITTIITGRPSP